MARLPARVLPVCLLFALLAACLRDPRLAARRSVATGNGYFAKGKLKEASILYRRALQQDPQSADAWYQLGLVNLRLSYLTDAQKDFAEAAELDPAHMDALVRLGKVDLLFYAANPQINSR